MNKYIIVFKNDIKNTFRDPTLILIFFVPLLIVGAIRGGLPYVFELFPGFVQFNKVIVSFFGLLSAVLPGLIMSFIFLEEKDLNIFPVLKITPVSISGFIISRMILMIMVGTILSFMVFELNGNFKISMIEAIQSALLSGLTTPIMILLISRYAKNKIEGLTFSKGALLIIAIPCAVFFLDTPFEKLLCVFPSFWLFALFDSHFSVAIFFIGIGVLSVLNFISYKIALKIH